MNCHYRNLLRRLSAIALSLMVLLTIACFKVTPGTQPVTGNSTRTRTRTPPDSKKVLFDNTHAQTAGSADWVIDGAFSDFADALKAKGYQVNELRSDHAITLSDLTGWNVFVIPEANTPFKTSEQQALLDYVKQGGAVFFIADHYNADRNLNRWDAAEIFNGYRRGAFGNPTKGMSASEAASSAMQGVTSTDWLAANFGVRFRYNALADINATDIVAAPQTFSITANVSAVAMHAGATLAITDPNKAKGIVYLPTTQARWGNAVDQGVYNGGGRAEGPFVAVAKIALGKAAFIGDSSPIEDATPKYKREDSGAKKTTYDGWHEANDAVLITQLIDWLAKQEDYTSLVQMPGLALDSPTSLLAMENPANSTEPQQEPWSQPGARYKWYDPSTFAMGAYRYTAPSGITVSASPFSVVLIKGASRMFSATVSGSTNTAVIWSADGGTVNDSGYYTAPQAAGTYTVTATAAADTSVSGKITVLVQGDSGNSKAIIEHFDTGSKTAYATGNVILNTGPWTLDDALLGFDANDRHNGAMSVRMRNIGTLTMQFDFTTGAGIVTIKHALYGNDGISSWGLRYSTDSGKSWTQAGSDITTSSPTLTDAAFTINRSGPVRLQIRKISGGSNRINLDDLSVTAY